MASTPHLRPSKATEGQLQRMVIVASDMIVAASALHEQHHNLYSKLLPVHCWGAATSPQDSHIPKTRCVRTRPYCATTMDNSFVSRTGEQRDRGHQEGQLPPLCCQQILFLRAVTGRSASMVINLPEPIPATLVALNSQQCECVQGMISMFRENERARLTK